MPAIPLPFILALLLTLLLFRLLGQNEPSLRPAALFTGACAVLVAIVGLRWTLDIGFVRFLLPIVAALLPATAWFCFAQLDRSSKPARLLHLLPTLVIALLSANWARWQPPIDLMLACLYFGYGLALFRLAAKGPDALGTVRFSDTPHARRATLLAAGTLVVSGAVDLLIAGDFGLYQGTHAARIVALTQLTLLPVIVYAVISLGNSVSRDEVIEERPTTETETRSAPDAGPPREHEPRPEVGLRVSDDDHRIIAEIDALMHKQQLFRDADLNLNRMARRAGIPSRQISGAINRVFGRNVSQVVNEYRIEEAKRLLQTTDLPVTAIIGEAGFHTKSNFNREFQRVTGMTPSDYRRSVSTVPENA